MKAIDQALRNCVWGDEVTQEPANIWGDEVNHEPVQEDIEMRVSLHYHCFYSFFSFFSLDFSFLLRMPLK